VIIKTSILQPIIIAIIAVDDDNGNTWSVSRPRPILVKSAKRPERYRFLTKHDDFVVRCIYGGRDA
jgi:hypothetical protein